MLINRIHTYDEINVVFVIEWIREESMLTCIKHDRSDTNNTDAQGEDAF